MRGFWIALAFLSATGAAFYLGRNYNSDSGSSESRLPSPAEDLSPWVGVSIRDLDPLDAANLGVDLNSGVLVTRVDPLGPAYGVLKNNDFITKIQNSPISNVVAWFEALNQLGIGETVDCQFQRGDAMKRVELKIAGQVPGAVSIFTGREPQFEAAGGLEEIFENSNAEMEDLKRQMEELQDRIEASEKD